MRIYTCDEPELRTECEPVALDDEGQMGVVLAMEDEMARLMYETNGCGIAAPQVGQVQRFIVVDCAWDAKTGENKDPTLMINPTIVSTSDEVESAVEGCLSVPGVNVLVERPSEIVFGYHDETGKYHESAADGLLARCVQHEIDHLDGITLVEKVKGAKRLQALAMLSAAKKQGAGPGSEALYVVR